MSGTQLLRELVNERLAAAAEEIFGLVEKTIAEYQDEAVRSKKEIIQLKKQIEQLTVCKPEVMLFRADIQPVAENLNPSLQQCDIKVEEMPVLDETENQEHPQVKEEQVDQCISPDMEVDTSNSAELRHPKLEPTTTCELFASTTAVTGRVNKNMDSDGSSSPHQCNSVEVIVEQGQSPTEEESCSFSGMDVDCVQEIQRALPDLDYERLMSVVDYLATEIGVTKRDDLAYVEKQDLQYHLPPIQCCKVIQTLKQRVPRDTLFSNVSNKQTLPLDTTCTQLHNPGPSSTKTRNSWISKLEIPWDKLPASLLQAITRGTKAFPADSRAMVRAVVDAMQEHCPNPNKAACIEVAKMIVSKYPDTFSDTTEEGGQFGKSFVSFVHKLKTRVEHVNRDSKCKRK
uniref:uncharacterized protein n=1 Tax=Semicossyphus pulcher TaxID=241346 RepID=UPI0037E7D4C1